MKELAVKMNVGIKRLSNVKINLKLWHEKVGVYTTAVFCSQQYINYCDCIKIFFATDFFEVVPNQNNSIFATIFIVKMLFSIVLFVSTFILSKFNFIGYIWFTTQHQ